ncbi:dUTP diphosphatase, partial [Candidatus Parcubacteria bacterium]|nr:dUTP diphosphatase [Candidatus Parcubacteria bacterium]
MLTLKIKKLKPDAKLPSYGHPGDAGLDIFCSEAVTFSPGEKTAVPTGIAMEIPDGYVGLIWDKSGLAVKNGLKLLGGVIDSGYRGEILVGMINLSAEVYNFEKGHKVAQMLIQKKETVEIEEATELAETPR